MSALGRIRRFRRETRQPTLRVRNGASRRRGCPSLVRSSYDPGTQHSGGCQPTTRRAPRSPHFSTGSPTPPICRTAAPPAEHLCRRPIPVWPCPPSPPGLVDGRHGSPRHDWPPDHAKFGRGGSGASGTPSCPPDRTATSLCPSPCRSPAPPSHRTTPATRHVSRNPTNSTRDRPTRSRPWISTFSTSPRRMASSSAASPGRRSIPRRTVVGRSVNTWATVQPWLVAIALRCATCSSAEHEPEDHRRCWINQ